jgi:Family of unknown function (DUF6600)/FecR protein
MPKPGKSALLAVLGMSGLLFAVPSFADSHARIVRLSDVEGSVQIDRNVGQGYERAFLNLPITQGAKVQTRNDGRAEVEFEDGSILHLAPGTAVDFPQLSLSDSGAKISAVNVAKGTAYLSFAGRKGDQLSLTFGHEHVAFTQPAHVRLQIEDNRATLAVLDGSVRVESSAGSVLVARKQSATFDLGLGAYVLAKNVEGEPFDQWDKEQLQYHNRYLSQNSYNPSPYSYGVSDLNYYGNFITVGGMSSCWQPYFTGAGWNPFMNGAWVWYPSGYTWVSSYPWGWMPYYYGSWNYLSGGGGWCWSPGNSWGAWNAVPLVSRAPAGFVPLRPPRNPVHSLVLVNRGSAASLQRGFYGNRLMIARGSAGLGVARGSVNNMSRVSQQVEERGSATTAFRATPMNTMPARASARSGAPAWQGYGQTTGSAADASGGYGSAAQSSPSAPRMGSSAPSMSRSAGPAASGPRR